MLNDLWRKFSAFSSTWTGTIILVLLFIFFVAQSFIIPSGSMKRTLLIGDALFATKYDYGIPLPTIPWINLQVVPDFFDNGHLIEGERPKRGDIVIFRYPKNPNDHYVKRCVAIAGDEVIYTQHSLYLRPHEGDAYILEHYPKAKIVTLADRLWVKDPYKDNYPGIQYKPERYSVFELMLHHLNYNQELAMFPTYIPKLADSKTYIVNDRPINAFYKKIEADHYFMVGDNRDNSNDSRIWGAVPYRLIIGKPAVIWMSMEFRSYETVFGKPPNFGGQDHQALKRVCGSLSIESEACKRAWEKHRFSVRWGRVGRRIETLQRQEPILE